MDLKKTLEEIAVCTVVGAVGGAILLSKLDGTFFDINKQLTLFDGVALKTGALMYGALAGAGISNIAYYIRRLYR